MPTALLVLAHHRSDSLTAQVTAQALDRLADAGFTVDLLDLHAEGFDPRMTTADEPDWGNPAKEYSAEVRAQMRRVEAADVLVVVFPVWWFSLPAVLKGWIDRVWNHGHAYGHGAARLTGKRMLWLGLTGESAERFARDGLDEALDRQLRIGISQFCGIADTSVRLVHDTVVVGRPAGHRDKVLAAADVALHEFLGVPVR